MSERHVSVYSGREILGHVSGAGSDWRAFDALGNPVQGKFKSMSTAVAAVNSSAPQACDASARRDNSE